VLAAVVLVLAVLSADHSVRVETVRMPDLKTCQAADQAFRAPRDPQFPHPHINEPDRVVRWSLCVTLEAAGKDA